MLGNVTIEPAGGGNVLGVILASGDGVFFPTVLYRYANLTLPYSPNDPGLTFTYDNSSLAPTVLLYARFFNLLNEASQTPLIVNVGTSAFVITGAVSTSGSANCLNVQSFGAAGDGVTDDTAAIQKALNQAYQNYLGNQIASQVVSSKASQPVQTITGVVANGSSPSLTLSLPVPPTIGNTLVLSFAAFDYGGGPGAPATPTVTDNTGQGISGAWTNAASQANGELLLYTFYAQVRVAALTTVTINLPQLQFNSYIAGVLTEYTSVLTPVKIDGTNGTVVPPTTFLAPQLPATENGDLIVYATVLSDANGVAQTPPGDFTTVASQVVIRPNGLNGALPVLATAYKNWTGATATGANENWTSPAGYDGAALMVAFRQVPLAAAPPGITTVCIPAGLRCVVTPQAIDRPIPAAPWQVTRTGTFPKYGPMAYSLVISDGVTLEIDGALIASPNASTLSLAASGGINRELNVALGWALLTNSAWLLNTTLGVQLVTPKIGNALPVLPWNAYLNGLAFNEGGRNKGITVTGSGQVILNGQIQASLPLASPPNRNLIQSTAYGLSPMLFARFYCVDNSTIENLEIISPWGIAIEWGHSNVAEISNLYIHDAPSQQTVQAILYSQAYGGDGFPVVADGILTMDMLRMSQLLNNKIQNCPTSAGIVDGCGYQDTISGNLIDNCYSGYLYIDEGFEFVWVFGVPYVAGVPTPSYEGQTYTAVTQNSQITENTITNCSTAVPFVSISGQVGSSYLIETDSGSDGFGFMSGAWAVIYGALGTDASAIPVTGVSLQDNIADGNMTDLFYGPLTAFRSLSNNTFGTGPSQVSNGTNTVTGETPSGNPNGTNTIFTLQHVPIAGTLSLFLNGLLEYSTDYTLSGNQITFVVPPSAGSNLAANYQYQSGS
jgi:pectate lyase-like protein